MGAIRAAWRPAFNDGCGGKERHHCLARADIALQQPQHALRFGQIRSDVGPGAGLRWGERIGQRLDQLFPQPSGADRCPTGGAPDMRAYQRQSQLARQKLVIGKARPCQSLRQQIVRLRRTMQHVQRRCERRKSLARDPARVLPFRQIGHALKRGGRRLAERIEAQSFGERIDRLDQRQLGQIGLGDNTVGMHHLPHPVVERDRA